MTLENISYWALKSVSIEEASYKSINGYADNIESTYAYDSAVANHKQISEGDFAVIVNKKEVLAVVKIKSIRKQNSTKERRYCPFCGETEYDYRKTKLPAYRCSNGHTFDIPRSEQVDIIQYHADYTNSFVSPKQAIAITTLRPYFTKYNGNMSMQRLEKDFFSTYLAAEIAELTVTSAPSPVDAATTDDNNYLGKIADEREKIWRAIMLRRGQQKFRDALRSAHGDKCMVTGCEILEILEAAHINPYRGDNDHHIQNGLLLRADIHTLYDLDLIAIQPGTLTIHIHPKLFNEYKDIHGTTLKSNSKKVILSKQALEDRWEKFKSANQ